MYTSFTVSFEIKGLLQLTNSQNLDDFNVLDEGFQTTAETSLALICPINM